MSAQSPSAGSTGPRERAKRSALLLAVLAVGIYAAIIVWHMTRSAV
jgi:hypothetical protein